MPAYAERLAAQKALQSHPNAQQGTMFSDSFHHVNRTGGVKTAGGWQERRDPPFVESQRGENGYLHREATLATSRRRSSKLASSAARRGLNTTIQFLANAWRSSRTASRMRRRIRFLLTALPNARGVVKPNSGPVGSSTPGQRTKAAKKGQVIRFPWS